MKPARDRAVVEALLRALGVAFAEAEVVAPVAAPIDVRFREANFHLREVFDHPCERDGQDQATRLHHHAGVLADGGNPRGPAAGRISPRSSRTSPPRWRSTPRGMALGVSGWMP